MMRYAGQGWEIPVVLPYRPFTPGDTAQLRATFEESYRTLFSQLIDGLGIEVTNWAVTVATKLPERPEVSPIFKSQDLPANGARSFFDAALRQTVEAAEIERAKLAPGMTVAGPAVVVEDETSTIVTSGYSVTGQNDGSLLLRRKEAVQ